MNSLPRLHSFMFEIQCKRSRLPLVVLSRDDVSCRITRVGNSGSMGTPDYMAPEQIKGKRADKRTDIYNLGALLYEMLTGQMPFQNDNPWAALNARVTGDPLAPRKLNPELSTQAEEIVLRALQRNPADRYAIGADMKAEIDTIEQVRVEGLADRLQEPNDERCTQNFKITKCTVSHHYLTLFRGNLLESITG
jgi:serine/threonine protein kinase